MIKKHKKYSWPRKLYDSNRIAEENKLLDKYGLKNKREIWKAEARVRDLRTKAKRLITASQPEQESFFRNLNSLGLQVSSIADALALTKESLLQRRLVMILVKRGLAITPQEARQMISHKRVQVGTKVVSAPSYLVKLKDESALNIRPGKIKPVKTEPTEVTA